MKNTKLLTLLLIGFIFSLASCNDDKDSPQPVSANTAFLTAKTWQISQIMFDSVDVTTDPDVATEASTRIKFDKNGTYTLTRTDGTETGTWKFSNNETHLIYGPSASAMQDYEIVELMDNSFKGKSIYTFDDGSSINVQVDMVYEQ